MRLAMIPTALMTAALLMSAAGAVAQDDAPAFTRSRDSAAHGQPCRQ